MVVVQTTGALNQPNQSTSTSASNQHHTSQQMQRSRKEFLAQAFGLLSVAYVIFMIPQLTMNCIESGLTFIFAYKASKLFIFHLERTKIWSWALMNAQKTHESLDTSIFRSGRSGHVVGQILDFDFYI